ncbi:spinster family MFS transporter [Sphingomonas flavalba]|uniref:spinster family MFS transporter n=1 Tax=Sphingomonas flavalba TaxID=2559804 RepID=UPI00109DC3EB|nr:MFS transporter [Sphingomonas flavalba]
MSAVGAPAGDTADWRPDARAKYLVAILTAIYFLAMVDRGIFAILSQAIRQDLHLNDFQLGLLGGAAFAFFYGGFSLPAARLAERFSRVKILSGALIFWSGATALSGAVSNFAQMVVARASVGGGEAACHPCAHSLIADSFPPNRRATAASLYSLAIPIGTLFGLLGGAYLAQQVGWRWAFVAVGAPGILVALIARFTVPEPPRGRFDPPSSGGLPAYSAVLRHLLARPTFVHMAIGWSLTTAAWAGAGSFTAPYLLRGAFGLTIGEVGWILGILAGAGALVGTLAGGFISDRLARNDARFYMWVPAASMFVAGPAFAVGLLQAGVVPFIVCFAVGNICMLVYTGPSWGTLHNLVDARMRASAVATLSILVAIAGAGIGPVVTGVLSDAVASHVDPGDFALRCVGAALSDDPACRLSSFIGLRYALIATVLMHVWAGIHYCLAARTIRTDLVALPAAAAPSAPGAEAQERA